MLAGIRESLAAAAGRAGIERHGLLAAALIESGELAQGILDRAFEARGGVDSLPDPLEAAALDLACALARRVAASWDSAFRDGGDPAPAETALARLQALAGPDELLIRSPEGFAHYAVYPESYLEAARRCPGAEPPCTIGIRSIGTTLAAMASAAGPNPGPVLTLRPTGHPYRREISLTEGLRARLSDLAGTHRVLLADEGPGRSGSSLAAAGRALAGLGLPESRLELLPSHAGEPGPEADPDIRSFWTRTPRRLVTFEELLLDPQQRAGRLQSWCADLLGQPLGPLVDVSGGGWRDHRAPFADRPPVHPWQERRKFLLRTESGTWLLRFAGLGRIGLGKLDMARRLHRAGFVPEPAGWRHGFLVERWHGEAGAPDLAADRDGTLRHLARYLGFRAAAFPLPPGRGASVETLFRMLTHNIAESFGDGPARSLQRWRPRLDRLEARRRPVAIDGRLHIWEWLGTDHGLLKADAVDHHAGHDLVGAQDIGWDVAGAAVEFDLSDGEIEALSGAVEIAGGVTIDPELVDFLQLAYPAFQLGFYAMAAQGVADGPDRAALLGAAQRYRAVLGRHLLCHLPDADGDRPE